MQRTLKILLTGSIWLIAGGIAFASAVAFFSLILHWPDNPQLTLLLIRIAAISFIAGACAAALASGIYTILRLQKRFRFSIPLEVFLYVAAAVVLIGAALLLFR